MAATGTAILDFGLPGSMSVDARADVTGQTDILATSQAEAWLMGANTIDHSEDEHVMASCMMDLVCGAPVAGAGFTIYAIVREGTMSGQFVAQWVWK